MLQLCPIFLHSELALAILLHMRLKQALSPRSINCPTTTKHEKALYCLRRILRWTNRLLFITTGVYFTRIYQQGQVGPSVHT